MLRLSEPRILLPIISAVSGIQVGREIQTSLEKSTRSQGSADGGIDIMVRKCAGHVFPGSGKKHIFCEGNIKYRSVVTVDQPPVN